MSEGSLQSWVVLLRFNELSKAIQIGPFSSVHAVISYHLFVAHCHVFAGHRVPVT